MQPFYYVNDQDMKSLYALNQLWFKIRHELTDEESEQVCKLLLQIDEPLRQLRDLFWAKEEEKAAGLTAATETSSTTDSITASA